MFIFIFIIFFLEFIEDIHLKRKKNDIVQYRWHWSAANDLYQKIHINATKSKKILWKRFFSVIKQSSTKFPLISFQNMLTQRKLFRDVPNISKTL